MHSGHRASSSDIALIGAACRLPGAASLEDFWTLLKGERNAIQSGVCNRWRPERFLRRGAPEPGFAYTFAGGYIEAPFDFDPAPFNVSPREAEQMDPQQRLLLEVTWRAFEDAAIAPSSLAGRNVGVYVGASLVDYQSAASYDPAVMGSHFMTGNSLSILSNRISYTFDFKGPSYTMDSACSSSFVALAEAMAALRDGRVDYAVVAGVNLLLSPAPFIGFSQARMLSPTGLSRPFSQQADGYVRAEGSIVVILRRLEDAKTSNDRVRSVLLAAGVNSDGRTSGIALPSLDGQRRLMAQLYASTGLSPERLSFVEAHGTGTKVGDPIEASAIGDALGQRRSLPLPVGSVKSNIGHLEAASGLAGLLKATLAMERRLLPRSLFCEELSEQIDFGSLNLAPAQSALVLPASRESLFAGVCNYGFGGTNAHVILRSATAEEASPVLSSPSTSPARLLLVSAATRAALRIRADQVATLIEGGVSAADAASALASQQDLFAHRLALPLSEQTDIVGVLRACSNDDGAESDAATGSAAVNRRAAFVFSGNGSQFRDMGRDAYAGSDAFRREIAAIDEIYLPLAGWSIAAALRDGIATERLALTSVSQPLIFAVQSALLGCLAQAGVRPDAVVGHSLGEVAAAEASGALSRAEALKLIYLRSQHQEVVRDHGRMIVLGCDGASAEAELARFGAAELDIAALNGPNSTTLSGPAAALASFGAHCRRNKIAVVDLEIEYPFHSRALDGVETALVADLRRLTPGPTHIPLFSTVTGAELAGEALNADYWWRNVRQPVLFEAAVCACLDKEITSFIEIGARPILTNTIKDILRTRGVDGQVLGTLRGGPAGPSDPVALAVAKLIAEGLRFDGAALFGSGATRRIHLPEYPFQRQTFILPLTSEGLLAFGQLPGMPARHPLLGGRVSDGSPEWRNLLDCHLVPYLADHLVDGAVVLPASGLVEMALAAGRDLFGEKPLQLESFDIYKPLVLEPDEMREVSTRYSHQTSMIEVWSRKRFAANEWILHARGPIRAFHGTPSAPLSPPSGADVCVDSADQIYAEARRAGLEYRDLFRLVTQVFRLPDVSEASLASPCGGAGAYEDRHVLHPASFDACFHCLFMQYQQRAGETRAHLPIRFRNVVVLRPGVAVSRMIGHRIHDRQHTKSIAFSLFGQDDQLVATVEAVVFRAVVLSRASVDDRTFHVAPIAVCEGSLGGGAALSPPPSAATPDFSALWLLMRAFCVSLAEASVRTLAGVRPLDATELLASGDLAESAAPLFEAMLAALQEFGALEDSDDGPRLKDAIALPSPETLLATLLQRFPGSAIEIRLAAQALQHALPALRTGPRFNPTPALQRAFDSMALLQRAAIEALDEVLATLPRGSQVLVGEPFSAGLTRVVARALSDGLEVTYGSCRPEALKAARTEAGVGGASFLLLEEEAQTPLRFDVLIGLATQTLSREQKGGWRRALSLLRDDAPVFVARPGAELSLDVLCGGWKNWFTSAPDGGGRLRVPSVDQVSASLKWVGVSQVDSAPLTDGLGTLLRGRKKQIGAKLRPVSPHAIFGPPGPALASVVDDATVFDHAELGSLLAWVEAAADDVQPIILLSFDAGSAGASEELARRIELLKDLLEGLPGRPSAVRLVVVTAASFSGADVQDAVNAGLRGFARVAINEYPMIDLQLIDLGPDASATALQTFLQQAGAEREWLALKSGPFVHRVRRGLLAAAALGPAERSVLQFATPGRLDSSTWMKAGRTAPGRGEVEIEVAGVGLNFRDILVGLGVLDDDLLGAGLTAASLGFECSGTVTRVGADAGDLQPGDQVMGFGANVFASHVTAPSWHFFPVPAGLSLEAAATIPVAFATAWYSLVNRAGLQPGETVLIHGAAGGVGLAAIQIAKHIGARVIGTASDPARRAIALAAGADLAFDSRQERFVEPIQSLGGVNVVLNSLAGTAMQASFHLLQPFGRFVELGKRDYLDNTQLGLRPFVRNISYAGVDLDELLAHDRRTVETVLRRLAELFAAGALRPLPHQTFAGHEVGEAFRIMQSSEHIGKIVVRPATHATRDLAELQAAPAPGLQLVVGGTTGFGFETARWLASRGATTIVLASRRGLVDDTLRPAVEAMRHAGTEIIVKALDVCDPEAVRRLVAEATAAYGPLRGVVHSAAHLDDGLISTLTPARLRAVLRAKVEGVVNLDRATADQPLDHFIVYSSATTVIGSPGQGAYVAANAFLEGWARKRRNQGRPALAIGWGAIADAGMIARDRRLGERLRRTTGVVGIKSSELLAHLGRLLALGDDIDPVQFYTNISPGGAAGKLALLRSPALSELALVGAAELGGDGADLVSLLDGKDRHEALSLITAALRREVGQILRMAEADVDPTRPLGDLGLDSLMGLELHVSIERLTGTQLPMIGASDRRLLDVADAILAHLSGPQDAPTEADVTAMAAAALAAAHATAPVDLDQIASNHAGAPL